MTVDVKHTVRNVAAVGALFALLVPGSASAAGTGQSGAAPPTDHIVVDVVGANGSGCKAGTAKATVSPDNLSFKLRYTDFKAEAGGSSKPTDARKSCQLALQVHIPQGYTYAIAWIEHFGRATLHPGATGLMRTSWYVQGQSITSHVDSEFEGPMNSNWYVAYFTSVEELVYAPCGEDRLLNVKNELRVTSNAGSPTSSMSMTYTAGDVETLYHFDWKRC